MHRRHGLGSAHSVPGSSVSFVGGVVAYADDVKRNELGVSDELLVEHGAVSAEVAAAMAEGARDRLGVDVAVAVTGIAGPDGGTPEKPVGRVHLHAAGPDGSLARSSTCPASASRYACVRPSRRSISCVRFCWEVATKTHDSRG